MTFDLCTQSDNKKCQLLFTSCPTKYNYFSKNSSEDFARFVFFSFSSYWTERRIEKRKKQEDILWDKESEVSSYGEHRKLFFWSKNLPGMTDLLPSLFYHVASALLTFY